MKPLFIFLDPAATITTLEEKLIDLESDNGTMKEENSKLITEQENLMAQVNVSFPQ